MKKYDIIVTRHPALIQLLNEMGIIADKVVDHAGPGDITDKDVIGVLPLHLASKANTVTEAVLDLRPDQRGRELTIDEVRGAFKGLRTYTVREDIHDC